MRSSDGDIGEVVECYGAVVSVFRYHNAVSQKGTGSSIGRFSLLALFDTYLRTGCRVFDGKGDICFTREETYDTIIEKIRNTGFITWQPWM